ncbi:MAG: hypothetical protein BGO32_02215 [Bacteroidetes bacterium 37-13]|nr:MAG: hypothetical protein BGO32_02215 [Bacteroidetes bacterium 37-13]
MKKTALVFGATGLVGNLCLEMLVASNLYSKIIVLSRKQITPSLLNVENIIIDFENLEAIKNSIRADDVFCAMGTTIAKAGSQENFTKIDYEIPLQVAQIAKQNGAKNFILVSAIGADSKSKVFYNRTKGKLEDALEKLNYESLIIFQPSILLGEREDFRFAEMIGKNLFKGLSFVFAGKLKPYKGIEAKTIAKAMVVKAIKPSQKVERLTYKEISLSAEKYGNW